MTKLSVNVNKIATLRNARGNNIPDLNIATSAIIDFGADGITIHPRPDQRHIKEEDVFLISEIVKNRVEFNIEGYPSKAFMKLVLKIKPDQITLVPDKPDVLTSLNGWDTLKNKFFLQEITDELKSQGIRVSIFIHPNIKMLEGAAVLNTDRVELFTGLYAYQKNNIQEYIQCSEYAHQLGLGVNAGHDLSLDNLTFFVNNMPVLDEVSIGHALISESLFLGLEETIRRYKNILK